MRGNDTVHLIAHLYTHLGKFSEPILGVVHRRLPPPLPPKKHMHHQRVEFGPRPLGRLSHGICALGNDM